MTKRTFILVSSRLELELEPPDTQIWELIVYANFHELIFGLRWNVLISLFVKFLGDIYQKSQLPAERVHGIYIKVPTPGARGRGSAYSR